MASALGCCRMSAAGSQSPIFQPDHPDHEQIKERQAYESQASGEGEAVDLIHNEAHKDRNGEWIGPEFLPKQRDHHQSLHDAVCEQINGHEMLAGQGEMMSLPP